MARAALPRTLPCRHCGRLLTIADMRCSWCRTSDTPGRQRAVARRRSVVHGAVAAAIIAALVALAQYLARL